MNDDNNGADILFSTVQGKHGAIGLATLNRPKTLNALTYEMIIALSEQLTTWQADKQIQAVVVRANGEKAFCAGGDIRKIYTAGQQGDRSIVRFFWDEYRLNRLIHNYTKPYITFLDGITMGGGVGISMHGSHAIGTEKLRFAMPETGIGFFPDVGGSYLLSRCPGELGTYLGLSGARCNIADAYYAGLVKFYVPSEQLPQLLDALTQSKIDSHDAVSTIIREFSKETDAPGIREQQALIDKCFASDKVETILETLTQQNHEWCDQTVKTLKSKSPSSLKITLAQIRAAATLDFDACMKMEYRMVHRFIDNRDFYEGVRALIVDKDNQPNWQPKDLTAVGDSEVQQYFQPLLREKELEFI